MSHRRLERLGLDPIVLEALLRNDISTVQELLQTSPFTLMVITNSSLKGVETIIEHVSTRIAPKPSSVLSILRDREVKTRYLSTGLGALDNSMKGGLLVGCISEICGTPGIGKSQFCLSTALQAVMSSMPGIGETVSTRMEEAPTHQDRMSGVIYIDTELKFDAQRLIQMAKNKFPEVFTEEYRLDAAHRVDELLQSVEVYRPVSCKELLALVDDIQAVVISKNVKLIVIDSVAALSRKEGLKEQEKEHLFISLASALKKVAEKSRCVVLATNQVTPSSDDGGGRGMETVYGDAIYDEWGTYQPTLGPTWHHCVSIRLTMSARVVKNALGTGDALGSSDGVLVPQQGNRRQYTIQQSQRYVAVTKSPVSAPCSIPYVITAEGLSDLLNSDDKQAPTTT